MFSSTFNKKNAQHFLIALTCLIFVGCESIIAEIPMPTTPTTGTPAPERFVVSIPDDLSSVYSGPAKNDNTTMTNIFTNQGMPLSGAHKKLFIVEKSGVGKFAPLTEIYTPPNCYPVHHLSPTLINIKRKQSIVFCNNYKQSGQGLVAISFAQQGRDKFYSVLYTQKTPKFSNAVRKLNQLPLKGGDIQALRELIDKSKVVR